jgi:hypothetical protein
VSFFVHWYVWLMSGCGLDWYNGYIYIYCSDYN